MFSKCKLFQMQFLRKLFKLPSYTQHWFLMMESQSKYIEISFLKNLLSYWAKILTKPKTSLLKQCFDVLKVSKDRVKMKSNRYRDFHNLLVKFGCNDLIDKHPEIDEYCSINLIRGESVRKLNLVHDTFQNDIVNMQSSKKSLFIKTLEHIVK
jgi:hypothetical protein